VNKKECKNQESSAKGCRDCGMFLTISCLKDKWPWIIIKEKKEDE